MELDPGVILTQKLSLEPKRGQSHKHVQGQLTVTLHSGTVQELLTKILKDDINSDSTEALKKSRLNRKRNEEMSKKVDELLDHHWNRLEVVAKERVDSQLVAKGVVKAAEVVESKKSYIEQVMLGLTTGKKKVRMCGERAKRRLTTLADTSSFAVSNVTNFAAERSRHR